MLRFKFRKSFDSILALIALTGIFVFAINFDLMWGKVQQDKSYVKDIVNKETSTIQSNLLGYSPKEDKCFMFDENGNQYTQAQAEDKFNNEVEELKKRVIEDFTDNNDPVANKLMKDGAKLDASMSSPVTVEKKDTGKAAYIIVTIHYVVPLKGVAENISNEKSFTVQTSSFDVSMKEQCLRQIENPRRYRN